MSGDFNGDEYLALDADRFGGRSSPAATDDTSFPVSTYVENRLDANARRLHRLGSTVTYNFFTDALESPRKFVGSAKRTVLLIPLPLQADLDEIELWLFGRIRDDASTSITAQGRVFLELTVPESSAPDLSTDTGAVNEDTSSTWPTVFNLTLDTSGRNFANTNLGWVRVAYLSEDQNNEEIEPLTKDEGFLFGDGPSGDLAANTDEADIWYDGRQQEPWHSNASNRSGVVNENLVDAGTANNQVARLAASYLQPRTATIATRMNRKQDTARYSVKTPETMRAQQVVRGDEVSAHGKNLDAIWQRPTCLALGPQGENKGTDWPSKYRRKWTWADASAGTGPALLDRQVGHIPENGTQIEVRALVTFFRQTSSRGRGNDGVWYKITGDDSIKDHLSYGDPTFEIEVTRLPDGSSAWSDEVQEATTSKTVRGMDIIPNWRTPDVSLPNQFYWSRHPGGWKDVESGSDLRWNFREGLLWEEDEQLVRPVHLVTTVTTDSPDRAHRLNFRWDSWDAGPEDPDDDKITEKYFIACIQTSWWWRGAL